MSRIIQQIATVQFQVDNRKVTASMNALQTEAESLNGKIDAVKQNIKALGDVPADNKFLLEYQKQLRQLDSDLKDVKTSQRDLMKGVKAADQLWKAAATQDIESLSIKAIKAGQNGLRKRMENLRPELGGDEQKMYDAYKAVIDESDRVMNVFKSNYATVVQTIRDGGIVSEQAMKSTRDALRDLMESEKEGTAEHRQLAQQYDFLNESLANVAEMRRREKGEIVNANDARREALKLTEDGIAAARRERDMADAVIAGMQQEKSDLDQLRRFHEDRIAQTEREIAANQRLEEAEQDRLADVEKAMRYTENEDRKEAIRLRKKADAARDEAETKKEAYEQQAEQEKLLRQHMKDTGDEVTNLTAKIEALGKTEAKPKVDTSALDAMKQEIADIESQLNEMGGMHTADMKAFNERLWHKQDKMKEVGAQNYKSLTTDPDADYFNFGNKAKKIIKSFAAGGDDRRHDLMYSLSERGGYLEKLKELESEHRAIVKQRTEYLRAMDETGKKDWEEAVRQLDELDSAYSTVISILKDYKQQFDKIKPADDAHMEKYEQLTERRATLLEKMASAEQQGTTATNDQTEAIKKQEEELGKLDEHLKRIATYKQERQAVIDAYEKKYGKTDEEQMLSLDTIYRDAVKKDGPLYDEAVKKVEDKWEAFWTKQEANAKKFAETLGKSLDEIYVEDITTEHLSGPNAEQAKSAYRYAARREYELGEALFGEGKLNQDKQWAARYNGSDSPEVKIIESLQRKYREYTKELHEAMNVEKESAKVRKELDDETHKYYSSLGELEGAEKVEQTVLQRKNELTESIAKSKQQSTAATKESTQADQQSVDVSKQKAELEGQRTEAIKKHTKAQKDYEAQQEKTNKAQEKAYKAQEESVALNEKAATAEEKVAHQEERHAEAMDQQSERLRQIRAEGQRLLTLHEQQKTEIQAVDKAWADADVKQGEAEARKAQNQELTIKSLDDSIRKLKEANAVIGTNSDEWEENTRIIQRLQAALDEMKNKPALMMMTDRMQDVSKLSTAAVTETRKFWEVMVAGAERGSKELAEYEGHLKTITEEEQKRSGKIVTLEQALRLVDTATGKLAESVESVESRVSRATAATRDNLKTVEGKISDTTSEIALLGQQMDAMKNKSTNLMPYVDSLTQSTKAMQEQRATRQEYIDMFNTEAAERAKNIKAQQEQIAMMEKEKETSLQTIDQRIKAQQENLETLRTLHPQTETFAQMSASLEQEIKRLQEEKAAIENSVESKQKLAEANERLAALIEADEKAMEESQAVIGYFDQKIADIQKSMSDLAQSVPGFDAAEINKYTQEMMTLNAELERQQKEREGVVATFERERAERAKAIEAQKEQIALIEKEKAEAVNSVNARLETAQQTLAQLKELPAELSGQQPVAEMIQTQIRSIRELQKERFKMASEFDQRLADMNEKLAASIKADEDAIAKGQATIKKYDDEIKRLQTDIANYTQKLANAKSPVDAEEYDKAVKKMGELQELLDLMTSRREKYIEQLQREREEATKLAEAEKTAALAERDGVSQEQMEQAIGVLQTSRKKETDADAARRQSEAIDILTRKLKESTGEWMSLAQAEELASKAGTSGFFATGQQMQQATQAIERQRDALTKTIQQKQRDGEATKKEEEELQRLEKVLKDLKFEQDNFNMSHKQMEDLLKHPKKADDLDQLKAAIKRADGELHRMKQSLGDNNDQYRKFAAEVKAAKNELKMMEGQAKATTGQLEKAWSRLKTYVGLYMGFNMAWQKFTGTIGDMKELSDRMGEVGKTTQMAAGEIARMTTNLSKLDTRTALTSLVELSAKAGQLGLKSREDVEGFTEAANKMLVALPEMGADGATQMMKVALATGEVDKIRKQMEAGLVDGSSPTAVAMEKIASTIDQLRANSAAAAPQITDFVKRVGAVGAQSGISIDQVAALGSTVDALGMRVEMSATALSRMIPAIKNNAFDVAKAIGMAPEALRKMFDEAGGGMNAMLAIFQHIKDQGMNANDIEKMLGMGGMQEIMKELNQQGARAGIVFAGLSQNVDVLREHLSIAGKAYEENIAIQQEYDRMNETTAAKWERLGNQIEEMFVGPGTQSVLGDIADGLRVIVDLVSGPLNTAFWATSAAVLSIKSGLTSLPEAGGKVLDYLRESAYKAGEALREAAEKGEEMSKTANGVEQAAEAVSDIGDALEDAQEAGEQAGEAVGAASGAITNMGGAARVSIFSINGLKMAWKGLDATMKANIIVAVIALLWTLGKALYDAMKATDAERDAVAKANQEADRAVEKLDNYFARLKETKEELDKVTKSTEDATDAEIKMTKAKENHRAAILNINKNYGQYLGFMLTEYDRAELVAAAHDKITAAIRREMLMKAKQAAIEDTGKEYEEGLTKDWSAFSEELVGGKRLSSEQAAEAKLALKKFLPKSFTVGSDGKTLVASNELKKSLGGLYNENASLNELTAVWFARHLQQNYGLGREAIKDITGIDYYKSDYGTTKGQYAWTKSRGWSNLRGDYLDEYFEMQQKNAKTGNLYNDDINAETKNIEEQSSTLVKELKTNVQAQIALLKTGNLTTKETEDAYGELARSLEGINENVSGLTAAEQKTTEDTVKKILEQNKAVIDSKRLQKARENIQKSFDAFNTFDTGDNEKNPWGSNQPAESTDWKNMTAEQLVNRRKQMKDFVNAIQTDTDVQSVLKEDAALKAAIEAGMSSDMRTVIEWYNTERLKIQDELHARHLTNTGDWMDPKKERGARKQFRDEMDAYLHELDAYYTERKTRIEEAGTDEGLTEAEIKNRTLNNEMEWQQRRAELQKLYSRKQKEVTQEELDAIYHIIAERTGDSESFVKAQIAKTNQFVDNIEKSGEKGAAIVHRWMSQVELDTERSYLKGQQALTKQMRAIEAIIDKERPFNGITKSLQESLSTMDILTGEMRKEYNELMKQGKDMTDFNNRQAQEEMKRTAFLLGEAENAYSTTIDRVMDDMRQKGMTAWADWLSADPKLQEALMAQLRSTYDAIQDAIKKEASQLKKQAEIMWNNILMPDGKTTLKQQTDRIVAQLGLDEGRVNRANSLIGAGQASERVADKLAIQQMKIQLAMQEHYYNLMKKQGQAHVDMLNAQAKAAKERGDEEEATRKTLDAQHAQMSLNLATSKEETELAKQREDIIGRTEESQNRLYQELRSWADLLTSSLQGVFEASHTADREYYNERAKLNLTGKGGPGAGTYIVIDNEGTEDARAHYEYLNERQALERQREIENDNAVADAWKKMMDDLNQKMSDTITDQLNAMLQNQSIDANTQAVIANTQAIYESMGQGIASDFSDASKLKRDKNGMAVDESGQPIAPIQPTETTQPEGMPKAPWQMTDEELAKNQENMGLMWQTYKEQGIAAEIEKAESLAEIPGYVPSPLAITDEQIEATGEKLKTLGQQEIEQSNETTQAKLNNQQIVKKGEQQTDQQMVKTNKQSFAAMTAAANMYGIAYQTMSNDNLDTSQKVQMMIVQAAGSAAISMLTASLAASQGETAANAPSWISKTLKELGPIGGPVAVGVFTALLGGLMGMAVSKIGKSKSQIAQATGASMSAGRLSTGMLTYKEGNVNEFTDPASLTPGRSYNVDGADGKTYRAKYTGRNPRTHITNGPEFHLAGEAGREMIIDAGTTRQITMNEAEIWHAIKTLSGGGRLSHTQSRRSGVRAFADGNVDEFEETAAGGGLAAGTGGMSMEQLAAFQSSLDRNNELLERALTNGIKAVNKWDGPDGIPNMYNKMQKEAQRHGVKYL